MADLGPPSSYLLLEPGVAVFASDGEKLGAVRKVLADAEADVFDGIVIDTTTLPGGLRFVDAQQIVQIYERGVTLDLASADAARLPEPTGNPGSLEVHGAEDVDRSELNQKLRRAWELISGDDGVDES